ncbi:hypothetical protein J7E87_00850 [Streptomyces sp. ISL-1]|uniref:hypothetical protein n=1 Tax=Streptomyces sp. ISL-1 TaxID=2817657 RepID=UPI001BED1E19|nr:hypothetical protein [Streptomyces sp. ISL-1]MBT2388003.1 hypothetical protein [Streptomyces sp. ISL-1]
MDDRVRAVEDPVQKRCVLDVAFDEVSIEAHKDLKPGYVADWADLPAWQQETDSDIFERIEQTV